MGQRVADEGADPPGLSLGPLAAHPDAANMAGAAAALVETGLRVADGHGVAALGS